MPVYRFGPFRLDPVRRLLTRGDAPVAVPRGMRELRTRRVDISSTEVRERVKAGKPVRALVTDPVAAYIERAGLYRQRSA